MVEVKLNCESDIRPDNYNIENILNGKCDIVLYDNIEEHLRENEEGIEKTYYTYDMYRMVQKNYRDNLNNSLSTKKGRTMWLNFAKNCL